MTIVYFIISLGLLVFIHEFGHFLAAKKQGIGVEKFSLGFGPKLFGFTRGETTYMVSLLPLGGYVKLHGEESQPDGEVPHDEKSYAARPLRQKALVVLAGPFMNLFLAMILMPLVFLMGRMEPAYLTQNPVVIGVRSHSPADRAGLQKGDVIQSIDGQSVETWKEAVDYVLLHAEHEATVTFQRNGQTLSRKMVIEKSPETHAGTLGIEPSYFIGNDAIVDEVTPGSPAAESGLKAGDEIISIDRAPVETWTDMSEKIGASSGKKLTLGVKRKGSLMMLPLTPRFDEGSKRGVMGVKKDTSKMKDLFIERKYGLGEAVREGFKENVKLGGLTLSVLGRLVTFNLSYKTLGGPIRIAQASASAAKSGLPDFFYFLAFLSLQLGVLNLLPIPVLDGGHLLFFGIEAVQRKPVSQRVRGYAEQVAFFFLLFLMILVTLNDVDSVWGFKDILLKIKSLF